MNTFITLLRRPISLFALSGVALSCSAVLIVQHLTLLASTQDTVLPLVTDVPVLERRNELLKQQLEMTELQASLRVGSAQERVDAYVIPDAFDTQRIVAIFDILGALINGRSDVRMVERVVLGKEETVRSGLSALPITVTVAGTDVALQDVINFLNLAGTLTVADALSPTQRSQLLQRTEEENPAGIVAVEQFFSTDLLDYVLEPQPVEDRLKRSFGSTDFEEMINTMLSESQLANARRLLGGQNGHTLRQQNLWPMPMLKIATVEAVPGEADGWSRLTLVLRAYRHSR